MQILEQKPKVNNEEDEGGKRKGTVIQFEI